MSQVPTKGRVVIAEGLRARSNGDDSAPAMITRVWSRRDADKAWLVNVTIFVDAAGPNIATSVYLYESADAARNALAENPHATVLYWPERV